MGLVKTNAGHDVIGLYKNLLRINVAIFQVTNAAVFKNAEYFAKFDLTAASQQEWKNRFSAGGIIGELLLIPPVVDQCPGHKIAQCPYQK